MKIYRVSFYHGDHYLVFKDIVDVFVETGTVKNMD